MSSTPRPAGSGDPSDLRTDPELELRKVDGDAAVGSRSAMYLEGRYELYELLSEGGMGAVYRARHKQLDRTVAIKFMSADLRDDPEARRRFTVEAKVASSLQHPNIVSVTDFGIDPELGAFLVMELLHGQTLRARMAEQVLRARVACDIVEQVAWALRYMHARDLVHCDLKPENVFLTRPDEESRRRNHVKLIDFGLAFRAASQPVSIAGTPPYLAPERLRGAPPSPRTDLYSLGALFYELLTGRAPYEGTLIEVMDQQLGGHLPPPPSRIVDEPLEARTDDVVMRALSPDPDERPLNVETFLFELRTLMAMMGMRVRRVTRSSLRVTAPPERVPIEARPTPRHGRRVHERVPIALNVSLHRQGALIAVGETENVSKGGVFVNLSPALPIGAEVEVELPIAPASGTVMARAIVRWRREANEAGGRAGCGLEWLSPSDTLRFCLGRAMELASSASDAV